MSQYNRVLGRVRCGPALEALSNTVLHNNTFSPRWRRRRVDASTETPSTPQASTETLSTRRYVARLIITPLSITVPCLSAAWAGTACNTIGAFSLISSGTGALLESSPATAQTFWRVLAGKR